MRPRILFAALFHESHSFLSETTTWNDFEVIRGAAILDKAGDESPTDGFLQAARRFDWEVVPTLAVLGLAGGPVDDAVFEGFWAEFAARAAEALSSGVDAVFAVLHGAMVTRSILDIEGEFLGRLRALPGAARLPIFGVLDLHANVSRRMCEHANALLTYRKNPHTDGKATGTRAAELLHRCLVEKRVPRMYRCRVPIVLAPPATGTQSEPMSALTQLASQLETTEPQIWGYNVAAGFSFADTPETGLTLSVITEGPLDRALPWLRAVADLAWSLRDRGVVVYPTAEQVLANTPEIPGRPILLVEPADNIGAGAAGDGTGILRALIGRDAQHALVALNDPRAVAHLVDLPIGAHCRLEIGGRGWSGDEGPVPIEAELQSRGSGQFRFEDPHNHLASATGAGFDMGPCAVIRTRSVTVLLTSRKTPPFDLGQFRSQGLDPERFSWIGVKAAIGHRQAYDPIAAASYYVDTPGPCSSNLGLLPYRHLRRPVHPLDAMTAPAPSYS
ncbi:MAG TPA: M81 family metallopeptidase [Steroidobacteraceae bacterium]|jgi:microcystin degradation protein MlrC|nr:M81 family metallopeptidase [Steroidobacteraceae bacterium]